jgi:glycosyltransferase involved in cell wall biosynthesis
MKIIHITPFNPSEFGNGGNHRAYQILFDLNTCYGNENVISISYEKWQEGFYNSSYSSSNSFRKKLLRNKKIRHWEKFAKNPLKILWNNKHFSPYRYIYPDFIDIYINILEKIQEQIICIIEHPGFMKIVEINEHKKIPTISIIHNLESFDTAPDISELSKIARFSIMKDFTDELTVYNHCSLTLTISKVEAGLLGGLGVKVKNYPYLPVGKIRERLIMVREKRSQVPDKNNNIFLLIGSANHKTTYEGMFWFLKNLVTSQIIKKIHLIIAGKGTMDFKRFFDETQGIEYKGFVEQEKFDELIIKSRAVIIPQFRGFGALTRIPELACAGVPVICSQHPGFALNVPENVQLVDNNWPSWEKTIASLIDNPSTTDLSSYKNWETNESLIVNDALMSIGLNSCV